MFVTLAERVVSGVREAAAVDRSCWAGATRSAELVGLLVARERLDALILAVAGEWHGDRAWAADGAVSPVAWLARRAPLTKQSASTLVRTARHVAGHDTTAKMLDAGDITAAHVEIAARAAKHREDRYRGHEDTIVDVARQSSPSEFRVIMQHWRSCCDAVADHDDTKDQLEGNSFDVASTFEGTGHLDGRLDPVSTAALVQVLDRLEPPDPGTRASLPRTLAQRRADALMRLVHGERPPRVVIDVTVDLETLAGRAGFDPATRICEIKSAGTVGAALVQVLACDAAIGRVLMRGRSEVLDLGRRTRLVTHAQRRALEIRDRTCTEPGCDVPATWCDAHHVEHWIHGGETNVDRLELKCRRHHVAAHVHAVRARRRE